MNYLPFAFAFLALLLGRQPPCIAASPDVYLTVSQELFFKVRYKTLPRHRAMAIGPQEIWGVAYGGSSAAEVLRAAVGFCGQKECVIYAIDDKVQFRGEPVGLPLDAKLPGPDKPLAKALTFKADQARGILLYLHGCDGQYPPSKAWISYYKARGLTVIIPDSSADARPPMQCPMFTTRDQFRNENIILRLRVAQTKRTIDELRRLYSGMPIYVHGQSEGGAVVQALNSLVEGIVVTGHGCGVGESESLLVSRQIPLLVFIGGQDNYIWGPESKLTEKSLSKHCKMVLRSKKWKFVYLPEGSHFPVIWNQQVMDEVSTLLATKSFDLQPRPKPANLPLSYSAWSKFRDFKSMPSHKAFVVGQNGAFAYSFGQNSTSDAIQEALYLCDEIETEKPAYVPGEKHVCTVYAVDDQLAADMLEQ